MVVESIEQAMSRGIVLFDKHGEMCQINTIAAEVLWHENNNDEFYEALAETIRLMASNSIESPCEIKLKSNIYSCEIVCKVRKVFGDRFRAIIKMESEALKAIA